MTTDEDDGPLLFSEDEIEFGDEDDEPNVPERFFYFADGAVIGVTGDQYDRLQWWLVFCGDDIRA